MFFEYLITLSKINMIFNMIFYISFWIIISIWILSRRCYRAMLGSLGTGLGLHKINLGPKGSFKVKTSSHLPARPLITPPSNSIPTTSISNQRHTAHPRTATPISPRTALHLSTGTTTPTSSTKWSKPSTTSSQQLSTSRSRVVACRRWRGRRRIFGEGPRGKVGLELVWEQAWVDRGRGRTVRWVVRWRRIRGNSMGIWLIWEDWRGLELGRRCSSIAGSSLMRRTMSLTCIRMTRI